MGRPQPRVAHRARLQAGHGADRGIAAGRPGWVLVASGAHPQWSDAPLWAVALAATLVVWRTRLHLLWLLGAGAALGWFGVV